MGSESLKNREMFQRAREKRKKKGEERGGRKGRKRRSGSRDEKWTANTQFWKPMITHRTRMKGREISCVILLGFSCWERQNHCNYLLARKRERERLRVRKAERGNFLETSWHPVTLKRRTKRIVIWLMNECSPRFDTSHVLQQFYFELSSTFALSLFLPSHFVSN